MSEKHVEITVSFLADEDEAADLMAKLCQFSHAYLSFSGRAAGYPRAKRVRLEAVTVNGNGAIDWSGT